MLKPGSAAPQPVNMGKPTLSTLGADLSSGIVVFLVALPLCLGIALASDAPLFSGVVAGIVGGLVVGALSGSHTSVAGPAAGSAAVVASQIATLGSFEAFLLAVVLAGIMQVILGLVRAGGIADFFPSSVIKGLLAAIGLLLILKQIPHLFGHDSDPSGEMSFEQPDGASTFSELARTVSDLHLGAALVGVLSLFLLWAWAKIKFLKRSPVPAPLLVVLLGVGLGLIFDTFSQSSQWRIGVSHLVQVPVADGVGGLVGLLKLPDVSHITNPAIFMAAVTLALVASLETLLNLEAVDKIDPQKRVSPPNRELIAQGIGNITAGLIGGLPITSVIVRSSVNINTGGKTKLATIIHGALLVSSVALFPAWLNRIPLSCLAAILIATGFKLATPKLFRQMWDQGWGMFLPFITTVLMILFTDLLIGVLLGLAMSVAFILRNNQRRPLRRVLEKHIGDEVLRIELANQVSFLSRLALSRALNEVPRDGHVMIDARGTDYIDPDVLSMILEFQEEVAPARNIKVSTAGLRKLYHQTEDRIQFVDLSSRALQESITPDQVLGILKDGNERFVSGNPLVRDVPRARTQTRDKQHPLAVVFSGTSSRTPIEAIFDVGLGDISCVRTTGNWAGEGVLGSLEYAVALDGAKLIVVMGHTNNQAIKHAVEHGGLAAGPTLADAKHIQHILSGIASSMKPDIVKRWHDASPEERETYVDAISRAHVERTIARIVTVSPAIKQRIEEGDVKVVGCMYNVQSGKAEFFAPA